MLLTLTHPAGRAQDLSRCQVLEAKWKFLLSWHLPETLMEALTLS